MESRIRRIYDSEKLVTTNDKNHGQILRYFLNDYQQHYALNNSMMT